MNFQRVFPAQLSKGCILISFALGTTMPATALAQIAPTCIGGPAAVPGLEGPPNWFTPDGASPTNKTGSRLDIDEPRWATAPLMPFDGTMTSGSPTYRILKSGDYLYVSFHAPVGSTGTDSVFFGFSEGIGATTDPLTKNAYLIQIHPPHAEGGSDPLDTPVGHIQAYTPGVGWGEAATPGWLEHVSTWRSPATGLAFGVNFRIAYKTTGTTDGARVVLPRSGGFRVFFGMGIKVEPEFTVEYATPLISAATTSFINTGIHVPASYAEWAPFDGVGQPCREGVTLDTFDVRTGHPNGCSLYTGDPVAQNSFTVVPRNIRGKTPQFGNDVVRVQLSLAEWGGLVADSQAVWRAIDGTQAGSMSSGSWSWTWSPSPSGPPANVLGNASIGFTCALGGAAYCPTLNLSDPGSVTPPEVVNQALLATLFLDPNTNNSGSLRIKRGAVYVNMVPLGLSEATRKATISLRGAPKPKGGNQKQRDVYVKVVRRNMPAHGDAMIQPPLEEARRLQRFFRAPGPSPFELEPFVEPEPPAGYVPPGKGALPQQKPTLPPGGGYGKAQKPGDVPAQNPKDPPKPRGDETLPALPEPLPLEYSSATQHELVSRALPVYEVHAYYETGETIPDKRGKPRKALKALAPFGYVLHHDTPFYGFTDQIKGVGCSLAEVQEGLYKVSVPVDGSVQIETTIRAEEKPKSASCCNQKPPVVHVHVNPRGCYCTTPGSGTDGSKLLPLAALPAALLIWRRRRRSRR